VSDGLSLHLIDAFADGPFTGNPAAVVFLDHGRPDRWMQQLAMEMNQAETAFLLPRADVFSLLWMTPMSEVDLCGHATLASAHYLWSEGVLGPDGTARFHTRSGLLTARRTDGGWIAMDFPAIRSRAVPPPDDITMALGVTPREVLQGDYDLLCVVDRAGVVRGLSPDLAAIAKWDVRGVIVTAPADQGGIDFLSRFFAPALGVPEDPVTGSAHCALAVYWAERLGRNELAGYQASRRGGMVRCVVQGERVVLSGKAVTVVRGIVTAT